MEKYATLKDVDTSTVTLKELVEFIVELRKEFPAAVRVLAKRLYEQEYGKPAAKAGQADEFHDMLVDDDEIIETLKHLEGSMRQQVIGTVVLSLHKTYGFGKIRVMRLWGQANELFKEPTVQELMSWCESRGIDYDEVFGIESLSRQSEHEHAAHCICDVCMEVRKANIQAAASVERDGFTIIGD